MLGRLYVFCSTTLPKHFSGGAPCFFDASFRSHSVQLSSCFLAQDLLSSRKPNKIRLRSSNRRIISPGLEIGRGQSRCLPELRKSSATAATNVTVYTP